MSETNEQSQRLRYWMLVFGHEKQPAFIEDLTAVLNELDAARAENASAQRYVSDANEEINALRAEVERLQSLVKELRELAHSRSAVPVELVAGINAAQEEMRAIINKHLGEA